MKEICLAGGCFWGTEAYMKAVHGVLDTTVGYANGKTDMPTYEAVCTGETGFAEAVKVVYDPKVLHLEKLLEYYFDSVDPVSVNKQGGDVGHQYRTGIYYVEDSEGLLIEEMLSALGKRIGRPVAIECEPLKNFYPAEEYHQDYLTKNPGGYCHIPRAKIEEVGRESGA